MPKSTNKASNDKYRNDIIQQLITFFNEKGEDVLQTASNTIAFPFCNDVQSDEWLKIVISIPGGSRDGEPFDGYEQAQQHQEKEVERAEKAKKAEEVKARKIEQDKKKREIAKKGKQEE